MKTLHRQEYDKKEYEKEEYNKYKERKTDMQGDRKRRNIEKAIKLKEHQEEEQENRKHTIARNRKRVLRSQYKE
jgi:hypothetical protein